MTPKTRTAAATATTVPANTRTAAATAIPIPGNVHVVICVTKT